MVYEGTRYKGVDAVIDKDFAAAKMAVLIDADIFIILTAVDQVFVNYGQPDQRGLTTATVAEMQTYIDRNQFAPGSMLPKVGSSDRICCFQGWASSSDRFIGKAAETLAGNSGTTIQLLSEGKTFGEHTKCLFCLKTNIRFFCQD